MSAITSDLDFLLRAANYGGGEGQFSPAARQAVDIVCERIKAVSEMQLKVARVRLASATPEELAERSDDAGLSIS